MKLVTVGEMKAIEQAANDSGISNEQLMQTAGRGLAEFILEQFAEIEKKQVIGLIGKGNNGGDTLIALTHLLQSGWQASALLITDRRSDMLVKLFVQAGGQVVTFTSGKFERDLRPLIDADTLILDGLLGTGVRLPLKEEYQAYLCEIQKACNDDQVIVAVDCPSGVDCDSGEMADETLPAAVTLCIEAVKQGLVKEPAFAACGEIYTIPLELPDEIRTKLPKKEVIDSEWAAEHLPERSDFGHKGTFGKVMVIGGSTNYFGAPLLAGLAAYRSGCGLVTLAVPHAVAAVMANRAPEITWLNLDDEDGVIAESASELLVKKVGEYNCLAIGPGIGSEETTGHFLERLLFQPKLTNHRKVGFLEGAQTENAQGHLPNLVVDADALRWLALQTDWHKSVQTGMVLTPHPGEMAALTGISIKEIQTDRQKVAVHFANLWNQVVVLKGALTVVAAPDGRMAVIPVATSALAKGGSGDVLTGSIASLIAQGIDLYEAAVLGAWIHANAGLVAAGLVGTPTSVMASDIINCISDVIADLE